MNNLFSCISEQGVQVIFTGAGEDIGAISNHPSDEAVSVEGNLEETISGYGRRCWGCHHGSRLVKINGVDSGRSAGGC